jgi:hypothetical protein
VSRRAIRFTLLLPDQWNKKFLMGSGGGGYVGSIDNQAQPVVNDGYATVGTDTGRQGAGITDATWALDNLERQLNFGYLTVHRTAEVAKAVLRSYYGVTQRSVETCDTSPPSNTGFRTSGSLLVNCCDIAGLRL